MPFLEKIKIFADGAVMDDVPTLKSNPLVKGITTNPSLMKRAGITDYQAFAKEFLKAAGDLPVSLEVFADDFEEMARQGELIAGWGDNVYVKIPISNTEGQRTGELCKKLSSQGVKLNVTAIFTEEQAEYLKPFLNPDVPSIVSVFAGRVADAGVDPMPLMRRCVEIYADMPKAEVLWASCRQAYSAVEAEEAGCAIITVPNAMIPKLSAFGKSLDDFSLDTVKTFRKDAMESGFSL